MKARRTVLTTRQYVIRGQVQGVGFRLFTQETALREGLVGKVANRDDGAVEAIAEGGFESLARFEAALRKGPPGSRVEGLEVEEGKPLGLDSGFTIVAGDAWI
ncbi:MAG: acylphosphatase [Acidobacteria bacterium]|nr:acylphosphatase [Acidobacteriota bacterium]